MDKIAIVIIIIVVLAGAAFFIFYHPAPPASVPPTPLPAGIVLFYSPDCPHCQDVEAFISANNIDKKVSITKLEVPFGTRSGDQLTANAELALQLAQKCKIDVSKGLSIPFLYDPPISEAGGNGKCYVGEVDIPNFLKTQAGIK